MALKDLLLVYARNIGKGFKKNDKTKQFDVALGKSLKFNGNGDIDINTKAGNGVVVNDDGSLGFELSPDSGNLLEQRKNGLYYGIEAPADTSNLYVSSSQGNDSNAGTRAAPLRTIAEAMRRNRPNQAFKVYLFEGDTHEWRSSTQVSKRIFTMQPYGDVTDAVFARNPNSTHHWIRSKQLKRPKVVLIADLTNDLFTFTEILTSFSSELVLFNGIEFSIRNEGTKPTLGQCMFGTTDSDPNLWFRGCIFNTHPDLKYISGGGRKGSVIFDHCRLEGGDKIINIEVQGLLSIGLRSIPVADNTPIQGNVSVGNPTDLTYMGTSTKQDFINATNALDQLIQGKIIV